MSPRYLPTFEVSGTHQSACPCKENLESNFGNCPPRHINPHISVPVSGKVGVVCALIQVVLDAQGVDTLLIMMKSSGSELSSSQPCGVSSGGNKVTGVLFYGGSRWLV